MSDKLILLDVDGVLLQWTQAFERFVYEITGDFLVVDDSTYDLAKRYPESEIDPVVLCNAFNKSIQGNNLAPFEDAIKGVTHLKESGYEMHIITKWKFDQYDHTYYQARIKNLENLFGVGTFLKVINVPFDEIKSEYINKHYANKEVILIDDNPQSFEYLSPNVKRVLVINPSNREYRIDCVSRPFDKSIHQYDHRIRNFKELIENIIGDI